MRLRAGWEFIAVLLLAVMVAWSLPRTVFHECERAQAGQHVSGEGAHVHADDHCAICDQDRPTAADDSERVTVKVPIGHILLGAVQNVLSGTGVPIGAVSRGPPAFC